jgi:hypothetical protein
VEFAAPIPPVEQFAVPAGLVPPAPPAFSTCELQAHRIMEKPSFMLSRRDEFIWVGRQGDWRPCRFDTVLAALRSVAAQGSPRDDF